MVSNIVHLFAIGESSINLIILVYNRTSLEDFFFFFICMNLVTKYWYLSYLTKYKSLFFFFWGSEIKLVYVKLDTFWSLLVSATFENMLCSCEWFYTIYHINASYFKLLGNGVIQLISYWEIHMPHYLQWWAIARVTPFVTFERFRHVKEDICWKTTSWWKDNLYWL